MGVDTRPRPGSITWVDLTVPDADRVREFYTKVTGWKSSPLDMGGYNDYCMEPPDAQQAVAGVCHARGVNADMPAQWLIYITVESLDACLVVCRESGGEVLAGPKGMGAGRRFAVIRDPAGAVAALFEDTRGQR